MRQGSWFEPSPSQPSLQGRSASLIIVDDCPDYFPGCTTDAKWMADFVAYARAFRKSAVPDLYTNLGHAKWMALRRYMHSGALALDPSPEL